MRTTPLRRQGLPWRRAQCGHLPLLMRPRSAPLRNPRSAYSGSPGLWNAAPASVRRRRIRLSRQNAYRQPVLRSAGAHSAQARRGHELHRQGGDSHPRAVALTARSRGPVGRAGASLGAEKSVSEDPRSSATKDLWMLEVAPRTAKRVGITAKQTRYCSDPVNESQELCGK
jgi:hypothetical protein